MELELAITIPAANAAEVKAAGETTIKVKVNDPEFPVDLMRKIIEYLIGLLAKASITHALQDVDFRHYPYCPCHPLDGDEDKWIDVAEVRFNLNNNAYLTFDNIGFDDTGVVEYTDPVLTVWE